MTTDRDGPRSNPYHPDPQSCCEACVFGRGWHAAWCFLPLFGGIASDCEYGAWLGHADFDAIGYLGGRAICAKCLANPARGAPSSAMLYGPALSPPAPPGDSSDVTKEPTNQCR